MSTTLLQSQWLDQVARGIEQECGYASIGELHDYRCKYCGSSGKVRPYAETGIGGWLRDRPCRVCDGIGGWALTQCSSCNGSGRKGSEWPSLCIVERFGRHESYTSWQESEHTIDSMPHKVWHILENTDAFALLEEAGCYFGKIFGGQWYYSYPVPDSRGVRVHTLDTMVYADSPGELLDKIMAEEEKCG